jgi:ATP-dependent Clp protease ATP-binding subunit ClpA
VFDLRSPIKKIIDKIGKHKGRVVLIIDEAHNLTGNLGEQFKSLLDTSSKSLPFVIGITTPSEYQKCIQTNANMEDPENTLARRFKIVKIEEPDEKETRRILSRVVSAEFKDISVKKSVLKYIFLETNKKVKDLNQPDKSVYFLSQAISKLKSVQSAQDLVALKQNALSKNASNIERLNKLLSDARSFQSDKVKRLEKKIEAKGKKIAELESQIENRKEIYLKYQRLTDLRAWHQNWLASTSKKISRESKLNKKTPEFLEKSYLFNSFFILHVLKEYMANFKREYAFTTSLTKEMVNESINDYLKNIGNALESFLS